MRVESLQIQGLRCIGAAELALPEAGAWLVGANGAGKTSVLEALCLLGFGRSFRGRVGDGLVRRGDPAVQVVARWCEASGRHRISGLRHDGERWSGRLDGREVATLSELAAPFPVLAFHPESSQVVTGPAEERRRALDWLAFHVEHRFAEATRRYARALKQRNALLRLGAPDAEFEPWEAELGLVAEQISLARESAVAVLQPAMARTWTVLSPDVVGPALALRPGWRRQEAGLADVLLLNRPRDRELGYTTVGPHRADLDLGRPFGAGPEHWSRGQAKLLALTLTLAQAEALRTWSGARSLLLLDDLGAELDEMRFSAVLAWVREHEYQIVGTGTRLDPRVPDALPGIAVFHVEHGGVQPLVAG